MPTPQSSSIVILENIPEAYCGLDGEFRFTYVNAAAERLLGRSRGELLGKSIWDEFPAFSRTDVEAAFRKTMRENAANEFEHFSAPARRWYFIKTFPIDGGMAFYLRDVTAERSRREALEEHTELINLANMFIRDMDNRVTLWSRGAEETYGYSPQEAIGRVTYDLLKTKFEKPIDQIMAELFSRGVWRGRIGHTTKNGSEIKVATTWFLRREAGGRPQSILEANNEITQLELAKEALEEKSAALERSNRNLQEFAYIVSHDLQAPLRRLTSFAQLLREKYQRKLDETADRYIDQIVRGADRMKTLISDLLNFARTGKEVAMSEVSIDAVMKAVRTDLERVVRKAGGSLSWEDLPHVWGNETLLYQLFMNLVGNGLKYGRPDDLPRVEVSARPEGRFWVFSVRDNGIGIPPEHHERIFGIFQRLHTGEQYSGTGIGLAICRRIVERHGGRISVASSGPSGSTFTLTLPAVPVETSSQRPGPVNLRRGF